MILDAFSHGLSDGFPDLLDRDSGVGSSPVPLWFPFGCGSPSDSDQSAGSPNSDRDQNWSDAGSPSSDAQRSPYQGVRVKVTVKELIQRKRHRGARTHPYQLEGKLPATAQVLQSAKQELENLMLCVEKRPCLRANAPSPCGLSESVFFGAEPRPDQCFDQCIDPCYDQSIDQCVGQWAPAPAVVRPSAGPSFFQWQIQQEQQKLSGLGPAELSWRDEDGDTFLHIAVAQGRRAMAYVLAQKMATLGTLDLKEHNNQSALQLSIAADQHLIAQDLLSLGAELNTLDRWGRSPLHVCAEKGHAHSLQAVQRCVRASGRRLDLELVNYDGLTPLQVAVLSHNAVLRGLSGLVTPLDDACVFAQHTALLQMRKQLGECVSVLLEMGASLETKDRKSGRTALHMAAEEANVELLRVFLDQTNFFSFINAKAFSGNTALHMAAAVQNRESQPTAVRLLLRKGADTSARNLENEQPAQLLAEGALGEQVRRILKGLASPRR